VALALGDDNVPGDREQAARRELEASGLGEDEIIEVLEAHAACNSQKCNHRWWIGHFRAGNRVGRHGRLLVSAVERDVATSGGGRVLRAARPLPDRPWAGIDGGVEDSPHTRAIGGRGGQRECRGCQECVAEQYVEAEAQSLQGVESTAGGGMHEVDAGGVDSGEEATDEEESGREGSDDGAGSDSSDGDDDGGDGGRKRMRWKHRRRRKQQPPPGHVMATFGSVLQLTEDLFDSYHNQAQFKAQRLIEQVKEEMLEELEQPEMVQLLEEMAERLHQARQVAPHRLEKVTFPTKKMVHKGAAGQMWGQAEHNDSLRRHTVKWVSSPSFADGTLLANRLIAYSIAVTPASFQHACYLLGNIQAIQPLVRADLLVALVVAYLDSRWVWCSQRI
jgi:hypothetical protein